MGESDPKTVPREINLMAKPKQPPEKKPKGHWPKGKRRNSDSGNWSAIRLRATNLIEQHWTRGQISITACAAALCVDQRSVARWIKGEDMPSLESQAAMDAWVKEMTPKKQKA